MLFKRHKKLAVALTCADWRLHQRKVDFNRRLARTLGVDGVDINALPGPDGLLLPARAGDWETVKGWVSLLVGAHHPVSIAVVAHQKCAGHPVSDPQHDEDVVTVTQALKAQIGFDGPASAIVAVYHADLHWDLKVVGTY